MVLSKKRVTSSFLFTFMTIVYEGSIVLPKLFKYIQYYQRHSLSVRCYWLKFVSMMETVHWFSLLLPCVLNEKEICKKKYSCFYFLSWQLCTKRIIRLSRKLGNRRNRRFWPLALTIEDHVEIFLKGNAICGRWKFLELAHSVNIVFWKRAQLSSEIHFNIEIQIAIVLQIRLHTKWAIDLFIALHCKVLI